MQTNKLMSIISPKAKIGKNVKIGSFCTIHENVEIGDDSIIEDYCTLGYPTPLSGGQPLVIGKNALIRSYSLVYEGTHIGNNLKTGHRVTIREKAIIGNDFQLGTLGDIQGDCEIGDYVRCHSNVHISQKSKIHNFVWIFPYVVLTNDPHPPSDGFLDGVEIKEYAVIATMSCLLPGVKIGKNALVGAHSVVNQDVQSDTVVVGIPAKRICFTRDIKLKNGSGQPAYPWTTHFHRGYPDHIVDRWGRGEIDF